MLGRIMVLEGIDGSGKKTQAELLCGNLKSKGWRCAMLSFPCYDDTFFGREVGLYLDGAYGELSEIDPKLAALLYAADRFEMKHRIQGLIKEGTNLVIDRYVSSNIAHHGAKIALPDRGEFRRWVETVEYRVFGLPKPDVNIFLDIEPKLADVLVGEKSKRVYTKKARDLHEEDSRYLEEVYSIYSELSLEANWKRVMCQRRGALRDPKDIGDELLRIAVDTLGKATAASEGR